MRFLPTVTLCLLLFGSLAAQSTISGRVIDERHEAVIGANVYLYGTYDGTSTDTEGEFSFSTFEGDSIRLIVSYLGYETIEWLRTVEEIIAEPLAIQLTPAANSLNEVVITAGAFEAGDQKKAVVLSPIDIVTTAGATGDIVGALQTLPGAQRVGEDGRLFVRGGAAYETRTFIDGTYVANPYTSSVPNLPARGRFSPFLFKGTTFSTGGYSAEYGQALSSALILESQDLAPESLTSLSIMSVGLSAARTERWENTSLSLSGDYTDLSPYMGLVPQDVDWVKAPRTAGGQMIFRHQFEPGNLLKVQAQHHRSWFSLRTPDPRELETVLPVALSNDYSYANASWRTTIGKEWSLLAALGYTRNADHTNTVVDIEDHQSSLISKLRLSRGLGAKHVLRMGGEFWQESFSSQLRVEGYEELYAINDKYAAAFAEVDWRLSDRLLARTGLRLERSSVLQDAALSPRLSLAYKSGDYSQFSLAAGRFVQRPEVAYLLEGQELEMEQAQHLILNWQWSKGGRTLRTEAYYKFYDRLSLEETPDLTTNNGDGYARGIELFYRDRLTIPNSDFWLSYSWLDTKRRFRNFPVRATPDFAAEHNVSVVYKYWIAKWNMLLGATASYSSPRSFNDPNSFQFNAGRTSPYRDLSFNASYLTQIGGHFTILHVSATNLMGFDNTFGEQFSSEPGADGQFSSLTIRPPARRFIFVGLFVSLGQKLDDNIN